MSFTKLCDIFTELMVIILCAARSGKEGHSKGDGLLFLFSKGPRMLIKYLNNNNN